MKLTKNKLWETVRWKMRVFLVSGEEDSGNKSEGVNQVWGGYFSTGEVPAVGKDIGRPPSPAGGLEGKNG